MMDLRSLPSTRLHKLPSLSMITHVSTIAAAVFALPQTRIPLHFMPDTHATAADSKIVQCCKSQCHAQLQLHIYCYTFNCAPWDPHKQYMEVCSMVHHALLRETDAALTP